jgi:uncharacterized membrane protein YedE/YeeE
MLVMIGGLIPSILFNRIVINAQQTPVLSHRWFMPSNKHIEFQLVFGAVLFGAGWGLAGICPGPGLLLTAAIFQVGHLGMILFWVSYAVGSKLLTPRIAFLIVRNKPSK